MADQVDEGVGRLNGELRADDRDLGLDRFGNDKRFAFWDLVPPRPYAISEGWLSPWTPRFRDCDSCGGKGEVIAASPTREGIVDRRLQCGCGRTWRQVIAD